MVLLELCGTGFLIVGPSHCLACLLSRNRLLLVAWKGSKYFIIEMISILGLSVIKIL